MGTALRARGVEIPSHVTSVWSARALLTAPAAIRELHLEYIAAGADVITTNNYACTRPLLARDGLEDQLGSLTESALSLVEEARRQSGRDVRIAASLPPLTTSYRHDMVLDDDELSRQYAEIVEVVEPRCDLIICETMSSIREAVGALRAARSAGHPVWVALTLQGAWQGRLPSGETLEDAVEALEPLSPDALLVNCCATNLATDAVQRLASVWSGPFGAYGNADEVDVVDRSADRPTSEDVVRRPVDIAGYVDAASEWLQAGASIIGGCCDTLPSHTAALRTLL